MATNSVIERINKKVKDIEISSRKLMDAIIMGSYASAFKGTGLIFSEYREYVPGDDVRAISWPMLAKTQKVYVKRFDEERELNVHFIVDMSPSMYLGSKLETKLEMAATLFGTIAFTGVKNGDQIGLTLYSNKVVKHYPPVKSDKKVRRFLRDIVAHTPEAVESDLAKTLDFLTKSTTKKNIFFIISDFDQPVNFDRQIKMLNQKHQIIALRVQDIIDSQLPSMGFLDLFSFTSDSSAGVMTSNSSFKRKYKAESLKKQGELEEFFKKNKIDFLQFQTGEDITQRLIRYFKTRSTK